MSKFLPDLGRLFHRQLALPDGSEDWRARLALRLVRDAWHHPRHRHPVADQLADACG